MASYAYTFTSGDTVTPTKLNNARTVSDIVNADIKSDAAIAGSKISPTFTAQVTVPNGSAASPGIRTTAAATGLFGTTSLGLAANGIHAATVVAPTTGTNGVGIVLQTPAATDFAGIYNSASNSYTYISGSTGPASGGQIRVYGNSHATKPNFVELTSGSTVRMTVNNSGYIGIGTTDPATRFHVAGASGVGSQITLQDSSASGNSAIPLLRYLDSGGTRLGYVGYGSSANSALFIMNDANDSIVFGANGTSMAWISSAGYLGINDSSPAYHLDVNGDANVTGVLRVDATQVVGSRVTGWGAPSGTISRAAFAITANATYSQAQFDTVIQALKAVITDLRTHGLIGN